MKTFSEFMSLCEASDADAASQLGWGGGASITRQGEGGRIGRQRKKTAPEIRRTKAVGGGKTEPIKPYKKRSDVGQQRGSSAPAPARPAGSTELKPGTAGTQGSAAMTAKERQRKAYLERKAKESGKAQPKTASQALSQAKPKSKPAPGYTPPKASGLSTKERNKQTREGERMLRGIMKTQETEKYEKATGEKPKGKAKTKILAHVEKRMAN